MRKLNYAKNHHPHSSTVLKTISHTSRWKAIASLWVGFQSQASIYEHVVRQSFNPMLKLWLKHLVRNKRSVLRTSMTSEKPFFSTTRRATSAIWLASTAYTLRAPAWAQNSDKIPVQHEFCFDSRNKQWYTTHNFVHRVSQTTSFVQ